MTYQPSHATRAIQRRVIERFYDDVLNRHDVSRLPELLAPDVDVPGGIAALEAALAALLAAFPDIHYTLDALLVDDDRVAATWTWTGTHRAPFRGIAATNAVVTERGMAIFTLRDARIAGITMLTDRLGFLQQIGVVGDDATLRAPRPAIDPSAAPDAVYLVDTFTVPAAARDELEQAMARNRAFIRTLDGFRGDAVLVREQGDSFDIATIAAWASPAAIARAKQRVAAYYAEIGFDVAAAMTRWGATLTRTICRAPSGR